MRRVRHLAVLFAALCVFGTSGHFEMAAQDGDPVIGTWVLDVARTPFSPGPAVRSQTRTYEQTKDGVRFVLTGTNASGVAIRNVLVFERAPCR